MIWVYPPPNHPRRQWVWRKLHWRRTRRFEAVLHARMEAEREAILEEMFRRHPLLALLNEKERPDDR